ncbi:unnamed protein product, partial [Rotaria sordida]
MNYSTVNILDLSDEMVLTILNKLNNIAVLYSLVEVNRKLDRLVQDITFTQSIDLIAISSNEHNDSKNKSILDRFYVDRVSRIQHNIESFTLNPLSIDRVLSIISTPSSFIDFVSVTCYPSNIIHLNVRVYNLNDCLWLLDGRLCQLQRFIVEVDDIYTISMIINNT